ncbi:MAG: hypothetical protein KGJ60_09250 [Verrucomicrobiota bacterium]|nr:hypothetical protein [Verrucomicrobiota bacterium]
MTGYVLGVALLLAGGTSLCAQSSNRIWFAIYNGAPTPSSDVSVRTVMSDGSASVPAAGLAGNFVSQTNFSSFHSPYDVAVDPAMGKVYVLDNNLQGEAPEYIYSFNLAGTPAQIAASGQIIYSMPVPAADVNAHLYPLISGLALDPVRHLLYFCQMDVTTSTNSYVGQLDLASSSKSDIDSSDGGDPAFQPYYTGQIPGQGAIALDESNLYLGAINGRAGNTGVFAAPRDGNGAFSEIVTLSAGDTSFPNGLVGGVASDPQDHLIYYLTFNAGYVNRNFDTGQNALWAYDTASRQTEKISSGYPGFPDAIAVDPANRRYYFTVGRDGTGNASPTNFQAIYTGNLGSTNAPTLFYTPALSGEDGNGQPNAGNVALQGIFVKDPPVLALLPATVIYAEGGAPAILAPDLVADDPGSSLLAGATVAIVGGGFAGDDDLLSAVTNGTRIRAGYDTTTETLTLSGSDTLADYQQVLRTVAFSSANPDPTQGGASPSRAIAWTVTDGALSSATATVKLALLPMPPQNEMGIARAMGGWTLVFTGIPGRNYVFQFTDAVTGPWNDLSPILTAAPSGLVEYDDSTMPSPPIRFYRVRSAP